MTPEQLAEADKMAYEAEALALEMGKLLAGRGSAVSGAVLAELVSMWLAAHFPPEIRPGLLADWLKTTLELVPVNEARNLARRASSVN